MQTFLPYPSFKRSAAVLDVKRLGKQRVEVLQLLLALSGQKSGWVSHPAAKMWRGHETALAVYGITICAEWLARGYKDTCLEKIVHVAKNFTKRDLSTDRRFTRPSWLGVERFHASHRSNLLRKDPTHYGQFGWEESDDLPYYWPV